MLCLFYQFINHLKIIFMENLKETEKIISIIFESGASALYETIDQNTMLLN